MSIAIGLAVRRVCYLPVWIGVLGSSVWGLQNGPPSADFQNAQAAVMHGDWDRAIVLTRQLLEASPRDLKTINLMGLALTGKGHTAEANQEFETALKINPNFYAARKNLAINQVHLRQVTEAEANMKIVLASTPNDPVANMYAAELAFARKDYGGARDRKSTRLNSSHIPIT